MDGSVWTGLLYFAQLVVVLVFATSLRSKLVDVDGFRHKIAEFGVLPARWSKLAAPGLVGLEAAIIVLAVVPTIGLGVSFLLAAGLLSVYTMALLHALRRRKDLDCGCFGKNAPTMSAHDLLRNALLLAVCAFGLLLSSKRDYLFDPLYFLTVLPIAGLTAAFLVNFTTIADQLRSRRAVTR